MAAAPHIANGNYNFVPPTDAETLTLFNPDPESEAAEIERYIQSHPFVEELYRDEELIPARPHLKIPPALRPLNLTGGTLLGDDKIGVPPLAFTTKDGSRYVSIQYLGPALCGHPGIVHGGLLATLLDEGLARCCFPALPNKVGVTASLKIDYKKPTKAEQYVVLRAETTKVEGRKAWVTGWIETLPSPSEYTALQLKGDLNGVINGETNGTTSTHAEEKKQESGPMRLVEAEALFVEPKNAGVSKNKWLRIST